MEDENKIDRISLKINMEDVADLLGERDMQILQLKAAIRALAEENKRLKQDLEKQGNLVSLKKGEGSEEKEK